MKKQFHNSFASSDLKKQYNEEEDDLEEEEYFQFLVNSTQNKQVFAEHDSIKRAFICIRNYKCGPFLELIEAMNYLSQIAENLPQNFMKYCNEDDINHISSLLSLLMQEYQKESNEDLENDRELLKNLISSLINLLRSIFHGKQNYQLSEEVINPVLEILFSTEHEELRILAMNAFSAFYKIYKEKLFDFFTQGQCNKIFELSTKLQSFEEIQRYFHMIYVIFRSPLGRMISYYQNNLQTFFSFTFQILNTPEFSENIYIHRKILQIFGNGMKWSLSFRDEELVRNLIPISISVFESENAKLISSSFSFLKHVSLYINDINWDEIIVISYQLSREYENDPHLICKIFSFLSHLIDNQGKLNILDIFFSQENIEYLNDTTIQIKSQYLIFFTFILNNLPINDLQDVIRVDIFDFLSNLFDSDIQKNILEQFIISICNLVEKATPIPSILYDISDIIDSSDILLHCENQFPDYIDLLSIPET